MQISIKHLHKLPTRNWFPSAQFHNDALVYKLLRKTYKSTRGIRDCIYFVLDIFQKHPLFSFATFADTHDFLPICTPTSPHIICPLTIRTITATIIHLQLLRPNKHIYRKSIFIVIYIDNDKFQIFIALYVCKNSALIGAVSF